MFTLSGESMFLFSISSFREDENNCSHGTDVAGIHLNFMTSFISGQNWPSLLLFFQNSKGPESRAWRGKMLYSSVIIILLASLFGPWTVMLTFEMAKASSCSSQIEDLFCCLDCLVRLFNCQLLTVFTSPLNWKRRGFLFFFYFRWNVRTHRQEGTMDSMEPQDRRVHV